MTDEPRSAKDLLALIAGLQDEIIPYQDNIAFVQDQMRPFQEKLRELKSELLDLLTAEGYGNVKGSGKKASVVTTQVFRITDAYAVRRFFEDEGTLMNYTKIDEAKVIDRAKLAQSPDLKIPGVTHETRYDLRISEEKAK